jgi:hypothetical protein
MSCSACMAVAPGWCFRAKEHSRRGHRLLPGGVLGGVGDRCPALSDLVALEAP